MGVQLLVRLTTSSRTAIVVFVSSRTRPDDDVVDVTSFLALDVFQINKAMVIFVVLRRSALDAVDVNQKRVRLTTVIKHDRSHSRRKDSLHDSLLTSS